MAKTHLPYNLREGQTAYAAKVMANLLAILRAVNDISIEGLGSGDISTVLDLIRQAMVKAGEPGNTEDIVFPDGETVGQKFDAGTLNASILDSDGLFYFYVDPTDGHLYVTASDSMEEGDFEITDDGHLVYTLREPESSDKVHTYDLGNVRGPKGEDSTGDMSAAVYDPLGKRRDVNIYSGQFICYASKWGRYFLTLDDVALSGKTYYIYDDALGEYVQASVDPGDPVDGMYEKGDKEYLLTDDDWTQGARLDAHIKSWDVGNAMLTPHARLEDAENEASAWSAANVCALDQGPGWLLLKALGGVPQVDIHLQVSMFN